MTTPTLWAAFIRARARRQTEGEKEKFRVLKKNTSKRFLNKRERETSERRPSALPLSRSLSLTFSSFRIVLFCTLSLFLSLCRNDDECCCRDIFFVFDWTATECDRIVLETTPPDSFLSGARSLCVRGVREKHATRGGLGRRERLRGFTRGSGRKRRQRTRLRDV